MSATQAKVRQLRIVHAACRLLDKVLIGCDQCYLGGVLVPLCFGDYNRSFEAYPLYWTVAMVIFKWRFQSVDFLHRWTLLVKNVILQK